MLRVDDSQRRARLAKRHRLVTPATSPDEAAEALVALHSSDPATVHLSCWARIPIFHTGLLEKSLYDERTLLRIYGMRRTLWVVSRAVFPLVNSSSTSKIAEASRRRFVRMIEDHGVADDGARWLDEVTPLVLGALADHGEVLGREITTLVPELDREMVFYNKAGKLMGRTRMVTNTMVQLALEARVTRSRPTGTWVSSQYHWTGMEAWLGGEVSAVDLREASKGLLRRWLHSFGPATETDIRWWTGWTAKQARQALADIEAVEVELESGTGFLNPADLDEVEQPPPWIALLPSLDPTPMGWKERDWYLGEHYPTLFDRNGNAGPTVWVDGRVVGGWAQRKTGEIVYEIFDDVGAEAHAAIEARASELQDWMGEVTVTPRFRSPHDKKLAR